MKARASWRARAAPAAGVGSTAGQTSGVQSLATAPGRRPRPHATQSFRVTRPTPGALALSPAHAGPGGASPRGGRNPGPAGGVTPQSPSAHAGARVAAARAAGDPGVAEALLGFGHFPTLPASHGPDQDGAPPHAASLDRHVSFARHGSGAWQPRVSPRAAPHGAATKPNPSGQRRWYTAVTAGRVVRSWGLHGREARMHAHAAASLPSRKRLVKPRTGSFRLKPKKPKPVTPPEHTAHERRLLVENIIRMATPQEGGLHSAPTFARHMLAGEFAQRWQSRWKRQDAVRIKQAEEARQLASTTPDMDLNFYTPDALRQRSHLRHNPAVLKAIDTWWEEVADAEAGVVYFENYAVLYERLVAELSPFMDPGEATKLMRQEWYQDSGGGQFLDREQFADSVFGVVDMWTDDVSATVYVEFLTELLPYLRGAALLAADVRRAKMERRRAGLMPRIAMRNLHDVLQRESLRPKRSRKVAPYVGTPYDPWRTKQRARERQQKLVRASEAINEALYIKATPAPARGIGFRGKVKTTDSRGQVVDTRREEVWSSIERRLDKMREAEEEAAAIKAELQRRWEEQIRSSTVQRAIARQQAVLDAREGESPRPPSEEAAGSEHQRARSAAAGRNVGGRMVEPAARASSTAGEAPLSRLGGRRRGQAPHRAATSRVSYGGGPHAGPASRRGDSGATGNLDGGGGGGGGGGGVGTSAHARQFAGGVYSAASVRAMGKDWRARSARGADTRDAHGDESPPLPYRGPATPDLHEWLRSGTTPVAPGAATTGPTSTRGRTRKVARFANDPAAAAAMGGNALGDNDSLVLTRGARRRRRVTNMASHYGDLSHRMSTWAAANLPVVKQADKHFGGARGPLRDLLRFSQVTAGAQVVTEASLGKDTGGAQRVFLFEASRIRAGLERQKLDEQPEWEREGAAKPAVAGGDVVEVVDGERSQGGGARTDSALSRGPSRGGPTPDEQRTGSRAAANTLEWVDRQRARSGGGAADGTSPWDQSGEAQTAQAAVLMYGPRAPQTRKLEHAAIRASATPSVRGVMGSDAGSYKPVWDAVRPVGTSTIADADDVMRVSLSTRDLGGAGDVPDDPVEAAARALEAMSADARMAPDSVYTALMQAEAARVRDDPLVGAAVDQAMAHDGVLAADGHGMGGGGHGASDPPSDVAAVPSLDLASLADEFVDSGSDDGDSGRSRYSGDGDDASSGPFSGGSSRSERGSAMSFSRDEPTDDVPATQAVGTTGSAKALGSGAPAVASISDALRAAEQATSAPATTVEPAVAAAVPRAPTGSRPTARPARRGRVLKTKKSRSSKSKRREAPVVPLTTQVTAEGAASGPGSQGAAPSVAVTAAEAADDATLKINLWPAPEASLMSTSLQLVPNGPEYLVGMASATAVDPGPFRSPRKPTGFYLPGKDAEKKAAKAEREAEEELRRTSPRRGRTAAVVPEPTFFSPAAPPTNFFRASRPTPRVDRGLRNKSSPQTMCVLASGYTVSPRVARTSRRNEGVVLKAVTRVAAPDRPESATSMVTPEDRSSHQLGAASPVAEASATVAHTPGDPAAESKEATTP